MANSSLEHDFEVQIVLAHFTPVEREYRFAARYIGMGRGLRKRLVEAGLKDWRFDFAWPDRRLCVELEGGIFTRGRHTRGTGFAEDCRRYNEATLLGWRVLRFTAEDIESGRAIDALARAWEAR